MGQLTARPAEFPITKMPPEWLPDGTPTRPVSRATPMPIAKLSCLQLLPFCVKKHAENSLPLQTGRFQNRNFQLSTDPVQIVGAVRRPRLNCSVDRFYCCLAFMRFSRSLSLNLKSYFFSISFNAFALAVPCIFNAFFKSPSMGYLSRPSRCFNFGISIGGGGLAAVIFLPRIRFTASSIS